MRGYPPHGRGGGGPDHGTIYIIYIYTHIISVWHIEICVARSNTLLGSIWNRHFWPMQERDYWKKPVVCGVFRGNAAFLCEISFLTRNDRIKGNDGTSISNYWDWILTPLTCCISFWKQLCRARMLMKPGWIWPKNPAQELLLPQSNSQRTGLVSPW
jgi:hypothetical protein